MKKIREEKAITLIALIITIVVLLILAVVAINAVTGDGIIQHATNARTEYEKAQAEEEDMLSYYEGVLESGEVVPTVKQLQEKYTFSYFSSLKRAIENANGDETKTADSNAEKAVAGLYTEGTNKYVVLMKDTESNESIYVTTDMTINLGGKTLKFTTPESTFYFGKASADVTETVAVENTIDGRLGGSSIEKEIDDATGYEDVIQIIEVHGKSLKINSGKYSVKSVNSNKIYVMRTYNQSGKFEINNAKITVSNSTTISSTSCRGMLIKAGEAIINNCNFDINTDVGIGIGIYNTSTNLKMSNSNMKIASDDGMVYGVQNYGELIISNVNIYTDASDNSRDKFSVAVFNEGGVVKSYSCYLEGTICALYASKGSKSYIYASTLYGKGSYGMWLTQEADGEIKVYAENTDIITGEYKGKYTFANFTGTKGNAIYVSKTIALYLDNCNIAGNKQINQNCKAIETTGTESANINISNCRITGALDIIANKTLNLGAGMNREDLTITGAGTVNETGISYKGYDKTLMSGN